jgi:nitroreductase
MKRKSTWLACLFLVTMPCLLHAQSLQSVALPKPQTTGGKPLMQALSERKTSREFSPQKLSLQTLSNLLWAGFGINRPDGSRTAPSARNAQEIDIYVFTPDAVYTYDAKGNQLLPVMAGDLRAQTGRGNSVATAPVTLAFVSDLSKLSSDNADFKADFYAAAHAGFISQNIYLFCASEGMATGVLGSADGPALAKKLNLRDNQKVILTQCVGYPK